MVKNFREQKKFRKTEGFPLGKFLLPLDEKKIDDNFLLNIVFRYQKFSEKPIEPLHESFFEDKKFSITFCDAPVYGSPEFLHRTNGQYRKNSEPRDTSRKFRRAFLQFFGTMK